MLVDIDHLYQAVAAFNSQDPQASSSAAQWLADQVIAQARSYEATVFAAQTIRQKILFDFRELPTDSYESLRESIMNHLSTLGSKISQNIAAIMTQLAAALADLYLQVPEWNNFIGEMLDRLSQGSASSNSHNVLLTLFKIFPEEVNSRHLKIGENRRTAVEKELASKTEVVIQFLSHVCETNSSNAEVQTKVISCLSSWLLNRQCPTDCLAQSALIHSIIYALRVPECELAVHEAASDCIVNALYLVDNIKSHEALARVLQAGVFETFAAYKVAQDSEDQDKLQNYARVYCELCEALLPEIAANPGRDFGDLKAIEMLLLLLDYHDISMAEMTFNIWYRLSEFLYQAEDADFEELRLVFKPYIEKYIIYLFKLCQLEPELKGVISSGSEIAEFRQKAEESVKDVTFILGSADLLKSLMDLLKSPSTSGWNEMESAMFIIQCIIHNIVDSENECIPQLLNAIFSFPPTTHPMLLNTAAQLLGNLQEWLQSNHTYMSHAVEWLISLANANELFIKVLAESLENICEKGYRHLKQYFEPITNIILAIERSPKKGQSMENASHHLLRACTHLVNDLPSDEIAARLEQLCARPLEFLLKITNAEIAKKSQTTTAFTPVDNNENVADSWQRLSQDPVLWLDRLAAIYRVLSPWQKQEAYLRIVDQQHTNGGSTVAQMPTAPWLELSSRVWKVVSVTLDQFQESQRVVEKCCRTVRFLVRSMGIQSIVFIEQLAHQMMEIYTNHPHSCFLYLASILVDEYGSEENVQSGLIMMLNVLSQRSFALLPDKKGMRDHPDTVDDLFRLAIRFAQRCPHKFFCEPVCATLFEGAIHGLELDHSDANKSVSKFIGETIDLVKKKKNGNLSTHLQQHTNQLVGAEQLVLKYGDQVVWHSLNAALFHLSYPLRREMAEILFALGQLSKLKLNEWLNLAIQNLPHDSGLSPTSQQLAAFRDEVLKAEKPHEVMNHIRDLSRYYF